MYRLDVSCAGTEAIARAAPDGYTVGMATPGPITVAKGLIPNLGYDPEHDFAPIDPEESNGALGACGESGEHQDTVAIRKAVGSVGMKHTREAETTVIQEARRHVV